MISWVFVKLLVSEILFSTSPVLVARLVTSVFFSISIVSISILRAVVAIYYLAISI